VRSWMTSIARRRTLDQVPTTVEKTESKPVRRRPQARRIAPPTDREGEGTGKPAQPAAPSSAAAKEAPRRSGRAREATLSASRSRSQSRRQRRRLVRPDCDARSSEYQFRLRPGILSELPRGEVAHVRSFFRLPLACPPRCWRSAPSHSRTTTGEEARRPPATDRHRGAKGLKWNSFSRPKDEMGRGVHGSIRRAG